MLIEITVHCGSRRRPCRRPKQSMAIAELGQNEPSLLVAHGFDSDLMARLVRERLATATPERVFAGGKPVEVTRVRITDAGRRALVECR